MHISSGSSHTELRYELSWKHPQVFIFFLHAHGTEAPLALNSRPLPHRAAQHNGRRLLSHNLTRLSFPRGFVLFGNNDSSRGSRANTCARDATWFGCTLSLPYTLVPVRTTSVRTARKNLPSASSSQIIALRASSPRNELHPRRCCRACEARVI